MSIAEIQDNKWEVEASKPPLKNVGSVGMIIMMGGFALFFVIVLIGAVQGMFTTTTTMDFGGAPMEEKAAE